MNLSKKKAKTAIDENYDLIGELKDKVNQEPSRLKKNILRLQILNRETIIKSLEKFVK